MKMKHISPWIIFLVGFVLAWDAKAQTNVPSTRTPMDDPFIAKHVAELRKTRSPYGEIRIVQNGGPPRPKLCWVGFFGHTNLVAYRPLSSQAFDAQLFDENGKEVAKNFGCQFGKKPKPDAKLLDGSFRKEIAEMYGPSRMLNFTNGDGGCPYWEFDIVKSFRVKEPGAYRLKVQVRLFVKDTNGIFQTYFVPSVERKVTIAKEDLRHWYD